MGKVAAIIPAAGQGKRMGYDTNKQLLIIENRPVLAHTLDTFQHCTQIDDIIVVAAPDEIDIVRAEIVELYGFSKVSKVVAGGAQRQDSVRAGLAALDDSIEWVVVHDGARPLLLHSDLVRIIEEAFRLGSVIAAVKVKDTIKQVDEAGRVVATPIRESLRAIQTPQVFRKDTLLKAHYAAVAEGFPGTDDASLLERIGEPVICVEGNYENIKITTREDLILAARILQGRETA
ncbi:MAG TPA: 2-C-methyl-D-erythritol 4-phosphate cytidylyltransferase [Verrucomicrobiae bacterium]|nr:2-C-methyl-D-erythritol 4-phosphate cytidylyltransferase [Verrucomicrobiae bacterium]